MDTYPWERRLGARAVGDDAVEYRVWAPRAREVLLRRGEPAADIAMHEAGYGVYEARAAGGPGEDYEFVLDGVALADPCSRWQPQGLRGPSRLVSTGRPPAAGVTPPPLPGLVIYELHVGTFTPEGTFEAAIPHLAELARLGVGAIELMPIAEFPGSRGWGYDGVYIASAQSSYGGPPGLARLVQGAHDAGLAVILDVVYNHVGASGVDALEAFGPYFTTRYETPWGKAINYDDAGCDAVREWVCQSAESWIGEYGIDGLRLDAIHAIFDSSPEHIVAALARRVHAIRGDALVIAESGLNDPRVVRGADRGGYGCDAVWADDFHHALHALLTDERDGYYAEYGRVAQLAKAYHRPHVHDGDYSGFRERRFGAPADDVPAERFVVFAQNHDQVGNRAFGDRLAGAARALAAFCTLLSPFAALLFMGEEYGERAPFQFFSDHIDPEIAEATREGRRREFARFASFADREIPDPQDPATFAASKLTRVAEPELAELYARLIAARRELAPGDADEISFEERTRWLRVRRGAFELVCNFGDAPVSVACAGTELALASGPGAAVVRAGAVELAPMSAALVGSPEHTQPREVR